MVTLHMDDQVIDALSPTSTECTLLGEEGAHISICHDQVPASLGDVREQLVSPRMVQDVRPLLRRHSPGGGSIHSRQRSSVTWILTGVEVEMQVEVVPSGEGVITSGACGQSIDSMAAWVKVKLAKGGVRMNVGSMSTEVGKVISAECAMWAVKDPSRLDVVRGCRDADLLT